MSRSSCFQLVHCFRMDGIRISWSLHRMVVIIKVLFLVAPYHSIRRRVSLQAVSSLSQGPRARRSDKPVSTTFLSCPSMLLHSIPFHTSRQPTTSPTSFKSPLLPISHTSSHSSHLYLTSPSSITMSVTSSTTSLTITALGTTCATPVHQNLLGRVEMNQWALWGDGSQGKSCQRPSLSSRGNKLMQTSRIYSLFMLITLRNHQASSTLPRLFSMDQSASTRRMAPITILKKPLRMRRWSGKCSQLVVSLKNYTPSAVPTMLRALLSHSLLPSRHTHTLPSPLLPPYKLQRPIIPSLRSQVEP